MKFKVGDFICWTNSSAFVCREVLAIFPIYYLLRPINYGNEKVIRIMKDSVHSNYRLVTLKDKLEQL